MNSCKLNKKGAIINKRLIIAFFLINISEGKKMNIN